MSPLLLRAFVNERLAAVVAEILEVFEGEIAKYEEEASNSKQEIDRLQGLLRELHSRRTDIPLLSTCKDKTPCEQEPRLHQGTEWNPHIKEEDREPWASDQEEHTPTGVDADVSNIPHASFGEECKQEDTKPPEVCWTQSSEADGFQEVQEVKAADVKPPLLSGSSLPDEAGAIFPPDQAEQGQSGFVFSRESNLSHLNSTEVNYQCSLCAEAFPSSHLLMNHAFQAHSRDTETLDIHLRSQENSKYCPLCGKIFKSTSSLKEHMDSHAGLKLHRCPVCGKECRRKGDLKIHMRIHTGEKPFCCSLCCKSFTHSGHLKKHIRSHTGERPYRCDVCGRGFLQSAHLKSHLGTHAQKK